MADKASFNAFEEVIDKATDEEKSLGVAEKLQLLDKEIRLLHDFCIKSGLNSKEIEFCAEPLLKETKKLNRKKWWSGVFYVSLLIAFIAVILWYDPTYRYICVIAKLSSMKLLPYWDWTSQFNIECFIDNPYYVEDQLTEDDCKICKNLSGERLANVSQDTMANDYLFNDIPVVVTDVTRDWPVDLQDFDTSILREVYLNDGSGDKLQSCTFDAYNPVIKSVHELFSLIDQKKLDHWQGYWENCEPSTAKSIRKFYNRPYFLPPMAESASENWIFASFSSTSDEKKWNWDSVEFGGSATWVAQIKGKSKIVLSPRDPCDTICQQTTAILKPGESLVFGNRLWSFKRIPLHNDECISLAATVSWDQMG